MHNNLKKYVSNYKNRYFDTYHKKTISMTVISFYLNFFIGIAKLIIGLIFTSYWFIITAIYYIALSIARGHLLKSNERNEKKSVSEKSKKPFVIFHRSGYFIILLGVSYFISCIYMYLINQKVVYPKYIIYGIVTFAFYKIASAIYGLFSVKKHKNEIILTIKVIKLVDACVSIVATQCALLTMKGSASASSSSALLGMVFSALFISIGIGMAFRKQTGYVLFQQ